MVPDLRVFDDVSCAWRAALNKRGYVPTCCPVQCEGRRDTDLRRYAGPNLRIIPAPLSTGELYISHLAVTLIEKKRKNTFFCPLLEKKDNKTYILLNQLKSRITNFFKW